jgi:hypothetical protein
MVAPSAPSTRIRYYYYNTSTFSSLVLVQQQQRSAVQYYTVYFFVIQVGPLGHFIHISISSPLAKGDPALGIC